MIGGCHVQPEQMFNLIFGYYDRYAEVITKDGEGEVWQYAMGTPVPTGEVWVITMIFAQHTDTVARSVNIGAYDGADEYILASEDALGAIDFLLWNGSLVLKEGDRTRCGLSGLTVGKVCYLKMWGYKMKLSQ